MTTCAYHLFSYVIIEEIPQFGSGITMAKVKEEVRQGLEEDRVDMNIGAVLPIKKMVGDGLETLFGGLGMDPLGRTGLLRLHLEVHNSKEYFYPTKLVFALCPSIWMA